MLATIPLLLSLAAAPDDPKNREQPPHEKFELTIDGESFELIEGRETTLKNKSGEKSYRVMLRKLEWQSYEFDGWGFEYHRSFQIDDDFDTQDRQVTLNHANGPTVILTDSGFSKVPVRAQLDVLAAKLRASFAAQNIEDMKTDEVKDFKTGASRGASTSISYIDSDGDKFYSDIYAIKSGARTLTITVQYWEWQKPATEKLAPRTLESLAFRGEK